jgi:hypothetical protein
MTFQVSPGVNVSEVDKTTVVPSILTTAGAFVGSFSWGPANKRILIDNEDTLRTVFGKPDANTFVSYYTASSFLSYGNNLSVVRISGANSKNAMANTAANTTPIKIDNSDVYIQTYQNGTSDAEGSFVAKYSGILGNSLTISVIDAGCNFTGWQVNGQNVSSYFSGKPGTSSVVDANNGANDEIHIVVMDSLGKFTGSANTVLEVFPYLSKSINSVDEYGNSNYYKNALLNSSKYIYAVDPVDFANTSGTWGLSSSTVFSTLSKAQTISLSGGVDDNTKSNASLQLGYDLFANSEEVDVSLIITGDANSTVQKYVADIAMSRKDCVAFISPPSAKVVNVASNELTNIQDWNTELAVSSSYVVADSGWKYMFDKYNNVYRWIPLNGDIAGLCVYTDSIRDAWYSPAGFNRGNLRNVVKLAWNPNKTQRDELYKLGINPVSTFPGQGTVLYGDKTLQSKPSAFDRINVRRLFIVLEKVIAKASKYSLFEFNDEFSRAQFVALVTPFLREVQGRKGIYDFKVVCDTTNNTGNIIDTNQFVGDIYIKPTRAINYIQLNFVAVGTGVDFTEIVGSA